MSEINKDQRLLQKGRKNTLKEADGESVQVSLRDRIPKKLAKKLADEEFGQKVVSIWRQGNAARAEWLQRQEQYLSMWDEHLVSTAEGPFSGSSTLHIPMPFIVVKTLHARFLKAIFGVDPVAVVKARVEASKDRQSLVQHFLNYTLHSYANYNEGIEAEIDEWVWNWCSTGVGILKTRWDKKFERFLDVDLVPEVRTRYQINPETGEEEIVQGTELVEQEIFKTLTKFDGPVVENRSVEDVLIVGGNGNPQRADAVIDQYYLTASDLWTYADQDDFDEAAVKKIIDSGRNTEYFTDNTTTIKLQRRENAGQSEMNREGELDRYQILEAYLSADVDGSGINTEIVVWVHPHTSEILRATYLHRINKSGERPFFKSDYYIRPGQTYGKGLLEILHPLSKEMDAIHNMRIDAGIITNMPFGFYRASSGLDPETIQLSPGALIPLDRVDDVVFPQMGNKVTFGMQEESTLYTLVERLTGVNDVLMGSMSGNQGITRTATGARALVGESSANLDVHLGRLQRTFKQFLRYMLHMLQQRVPAGLPYRVTGEDGSDYWSQIKDAEDLAGDYDLEVSANSATSNPAIQQEAAQLIYQLQRDPLNIQLGLVTPGHAWEGIKNLLQASNIREVGRYFQKPPEHQYVPSPEAEANMLLRDIDVPVLPQGDHQGFLDYFQEIFNSDELLGQFTEEQAIRLHAQAKKHEEMMAALENAAAQQRNAQQMQVNQQQGSTPAPQMAGPAAAPEGPVGG